MKYDKEGQQYNNSSNKKDGDSSGNDLRNNWQQHQVGMYPDVNLIRNIPRAGTLGMVLPEADTQQNDDAATATTTTAIAIQSSADGCVAISAAATPTTAASTTTIESATTGNNATVWTSTTSVDAATTAAIADVLSPDDGTATTDVL